MAEKMEIWCLVLFVCLAAVAVDGRFIAQEGGSACSSLDVKKLKFRSPPLTAKPGEVNNKYFPAEFPKGHIGIRSYYAEVVDENGVSVPLSEVYLHHWLIIEYAVPKEESQLHLDRLLSHMRSHHKPMHYVADSEAPHLQKQLTRDGRQKIINFLGKGGETRHTKTRLPGPYVIESGKEIQGYETVWILNVHGLDTRGAVNRMGCTECRCNLFNATTDEDGKPLPEGYIGGLRCCGDGQKCAVAKDYNGEERTFHLEYTWEYVDWNECVIPTSTVGIDVTNSDGFGEDKIEFTVPGCDAAAPPDSEECIDTRVATRISPVGGELVNVGAHLHAAALDASLWGEDGRLICRTTPMYGHGEEAGNEKGYVVGIKTCHSIPGTPNAMRIEEGEKLKFVVKSTKVGGPHTGLMGIAGLRLVAEGVKAAY